MSAANPLKISEIQLKGAAFSQQITTQTGSTSYEIVSKVRFYVLISPASYLYEYFVRRFLEGVATISYQKDTKKTKVHSL